jgi:hypothetical protein
MNMPILKSIVSELLLAALSLAGLAQGQTACATAHPDPGVYICSPSVSGDSREVVVPRVFHLSGQINAPQRPFIRGYRVLIDDLDVYDVRLPGSVRRLSIELNPALPFEAGVHVLRLVVDGVGSAEAGNLRIDSFEQIPLCDPFNRSDPRVCNRIQSGTELHWETTALRRTQIGPGRNAGALDPGEVFVDAVTSSTRNLESLEADVADVFATDEHGRLYVVSHVFRDIELRVFSGNGGILYDTIIQACGDGSVMPSGIAVSGSGKVWIAANTTACFHATRGALQPSEFRDSLMRGIVILVDTAATAPRRPEYLAYLSEGKYQVTAISTDKQGNAYVSGTAYGEFPHDTVLRAGKTAPPAPGGAAAFITALDASGPRVVWSTLLDSVELLDLDASNNDGLIATGRMLDAGGAVTSGPENRYRGMVLELGPGGKQIRYFAKFDIAGHSEGIAVANFKGHRFFVSGLMETSGVADQKSFLIAIERCGKGRPYSQVFDKLNTGTAPVPVFGPALRAAAAAIGNAPGVLSPSDPNPAIDIQITAGCGHEGG